MKSLSVGNERTRISQRDVTGVMISALSIAALGNDTITRQIAATECRLNRLPAGSCQADAVEDADSPALPAGPLAQASGSFFLRLNPSLVVSFPLPPSP